jgi:hypothetical protein
MSYTDVFTRISIGFNQKIKDLRESLLKRRNLGIL